MVKELIGLVRALPIIEHPHHMFWITQARQRHCGANYRRIQFRRPIDHIQQQWFGIRALTRNRDDLLAKLWFNFAKFCDQWAKT